MFTVVNVGLTMLFGTLIALLLVRVSSWMRILLTIGLILVWSMPVVVAVQLWYWMTNFENGILNSALGLGQHDWYASTTSQLGMVTSLIVWGAIPFVTITLFAGLAQVPHELVEAAEIDGARPWRIFRDVTFPVLRPIFLILTSLSIIWDFGVFTQPFLLIGQAKQVPSNYLMAVYLYEEGYAKSDFGRGAAISHPDAADGRRPELLLRAQDGALRGRPVSAHAARSRATRRKTARQAGRPDRLEPRRPARPRDHGLPGLLDGDDGVQGGQRHHQPRRRPGFRSARRSRTSARRSPAPTTRTSGTPSSRA